MLLSGMNNDKSACRQRCHNLRERPYLDLSRVQEEYVFISSWQVTMAHMFCRNKVRNFAKWKAVFDSHHDAQERAGLHLEKIWTSINDPGEVFFLFQIKSLEAARNFISDPSAAKAGEASGVLDGEYHFLRDILSADLDQ